MHCTFIKHALWHTGRILLWKSWRPWHTGIPYRIHVLCLLSKHFAKLHINTEFRLLKTSNSKVVFNKNNTDSWMKMYNAMPRSYWPCPRMCKITFLVCARLKTWILSLRPDVKILSKEGHISSKYSHNYIQSMCHNSKLSWVFSVCQRGQTNKLVNQLGADVFIHRFMRFQMSDIEKHQQVCLHGQTNILDRHILWSLLIIAK